jgi:phosphate uptake regulator
MTEHPDGHAGSVTAPPPGSNRMRDRQADIDAAGRLAADDAARIIAGQYIAGVDLRQIRVHHEEVAARLLAEARTDLGRAYAAEYAATASELVTHLSQDEAVASGRSRAACAQPDGTPHPDPLLAGRGWQATRGVWQRIAVAGSGQEGS